MRTSPGNSEARTAHPAEPENHPLVSTTKSAENSAGQNLPAETVVVRFDRRTGEVKELSKTEIDLRHERYRVQRLAVAILGKHRVSSCHMILGHNRVNVSIRKFKERCCLSGLAVCGSSWVCSPCAARIAERRAAEIQEAMTWAKARGVHVQLVTFTTRHNAMQSAEELVTAISEAWRKVTSDTLYKRPGGPRSKPGFKAFYGLEGYIRALEVTHGGAGYHPHYHFLMFTRKRLKGAAKRELYSLWSKYLVAQGYSAPSFKRGVDIQDGSKAGEYLSKFGDDGELLRKKHGDKAGEPVTWDAADELTKGNIKKARGENRKPFQILQDAETCPESARIFREYAKAFHGRAMVNWSPGFKAKVGLDDKDDNEVAEESGDGEIFMALPLRLWRPFTHAVRRRTGGASRSVLLQLAERGGLDAVARYLAGFSKVSPGEARRLIEQATAEEQLPDLAA